MHEIVDNINATWQADAQLGLLHISLYNGQVFMS